MSTIEKNRVKNAPLSMPVNRESFVRWATEEPEGCVAAGWQPPHPRLSWGGPSELLRASAAKLVSLARRERSQTPEQTAASAGVRTADVLGLEHCQDVSPDTIRRVAVALQLNADVLVQLCGWEQGADANLVSAAAEFVARLQLAEPLEPHEAHALGWFRNTLLNRRTAGAE